jgi:ferric-dicitrate binding protein FerR (iron transport regulator)
MKTTGTEPEPGDAATDAGIEELLREVGARIEPEDHVKLAVQSAVHAEWQVMLAERRRRRLMLSFGIAASLALAVLLYTFGARFVGPAPVQVATLERVDGRLLVGDAPRSSGEPIMSGETLRTDDRARAAFALGPDLSVRLDRNTSLELIAADRVLLNSGAVYVDSTPGAAPTAFTVQVRGHSVRHVGTQYEVRTQAEDVVVSVREGRILIDNAAGNNAAEAGERIRVSATGQLTRTTISPQHRDWQWAASAAPTFDINDQPLATFLEWVARETGRKVVYASARAERAAATLKLRGSIIGLDPDTALHAVLSTTDLRQVETATQFIGIAFAADAERVESAAVHD